jgi:periplasmic protein TonB
MYQRKFTAIALGVATLHGLALWAVQGYRVPVASANKADALVTRTVERLVEPPKPIDITPPPVAVPVAKPPAKPVATPAAVPSPAPPPAQAAAAPKAAQAAPVLQPLAVNNPTPAPNAPSGNAAPTAPSANVVDPAAQAAAPAAPAVPKPPAQPAVTLQPSTDADHADTQYRIALPAISARLSEHGRVLVRVQVGTDGRALQVQLLKSSGYARLDDNALATVARWRFKPGSVNGVPTVGWVEQPVNYAAQ